MENSLYIGLSKQVVLQENMNIVANNIANLNTPGYRGQNMLFSEYVEDPRYMREDISLVLDYGQYQITDAGPVSDTGNPLDIAIIGRGFLGIQTQEGIRYTRAGNLSQDANGVIVNARGLPVASANGGNITIPPEANRIFIDRQGIISTDEGQIGQLQIVEFDNPQTLNPAGNGLYVTDAEPQEPEDTVVVQGKIEASNVQAVVEMTRMIEVHREYQALQNMMRNEHERMKSSAQRLARSE